MTLAFTYSDSVQLSSKMHPWDQIHSLFHGKSMSYISFGNTQIGSFCVMSKFALKIALTACNIICDLLFPSWQIGITISDFCKIIGIASIWDNTKNRIPVSGGCKRIDPPNSTKCSIHSCRGTVEESEETYNVSGPEQIHQIAWKSTNDLQ